MSKIKNIISCLLLVVATSFILSNVYAECPNKYFTESCNCGSPVNGYCITAGGKKFTYYKIAENLNDIVAPDAGFILKILEGGSIINIKRMRWQNGVKFAIVQSDVLEFYKAEERKGNPIANRLIRPLRVILPLYNEEVHVFARANSKIETFRDLKGKRIALGSKDGGSAMTGRAIYRYMFGEDIGNKAFYSGKKEALRALAVEKKVDAWIMVTGQPASMFAKDMKASAKKLIKLIRFDESNGQETRMLNGPYFKASIKADSYPWLDSDIPTITVKAFLISQVYKNSISKRNIRKFTESLCKNFNRLQSYGHAKWKEVKLQKVVLPGGWEYSDDALSAFSSSICGLSGGVSPPPHTSCSDDEAALGLCTK